MENLNVEIARVKNELNELVNSKSTLVEEDLIQLSQKLDLLINEYYENTMRKIKK